MDSGMMSDVWSFTIVSVSDSLLQVSTMLYFKIEYIWFQLLQEQKVPKVGAVSHCPRWSRKERYCSDLMPCVCFGVFSMCLV
jgi:hypothetical protein